MNTKNENQLLNFESLLNEVEQTSKAKKVKQSLTAFLYNELSQATNKSLPLAKVQVLARDYMTEHRNYFSSFGTHYDSYGKAIKSVKALVEQYNKKNDDDTKQAIDKHIEALKRINKRVNNAVKYALLNHDQKLTNINFNSEYEFGGKLVDDNVTLVSK